MWFDCHSHLLLFTDSFCFVMGMKTTVIFMDAMSHANWSVHGDAAIALLLLILALPLCLLLFDCSRRVQGSLVRSRRRQRNAPWIGYPVWSYQLERVTDKLSLLWILKVEQDHLLLSGVTETGDILFPHARTHKMDQ